MLRIILTVELYDEYCVLYAVVMGSEDPLSVLLGEKERSYIEMIAEPLPFSSYHPKHATGRFTYYITKVQNREQPYTVLEARGLCPETLVKSNFQMIEAMQHDRK